MRGLLRRELSVWPFEAREDAALVVSELLCNALRHGRALDDGLLAVRWTIGHDHVEIVVTDGGGPGRPAALEVPSTATWGRGLGIVARVTSRWGVDRTSDETAVWAVVPRSGHTPERDGRDEPRRTGGGTR